MITLEKHLAAHASVNPGEEDAHRRSGADGYPGGAPHERTTFPRTICNPRSDQRRPQPRQSSGIVDTHPPPGASTRPGEYQHHDTSTTRAH